MQDDIKPPQPSSVPPTPAAPAGPQPPKPGNSNKKWLSLIIGILLITGIAAAFAWHNSDKKPVSSATTTTNNQTAAKTQTNVQGIQLDTAKNYGNKYASGLLPVGDGKYVTDAAKAGYIYACSSYAQNIKTQTGGAGTRGPWFVNNNTQYDINKKLHVKGNVIWQAEFTNNVSGSTRTITTNDLPTHPTGVFPISASDPAFAYDRNPNSIKGQTMTYSLSADPTYGTPQCMGGQAGVMLTGVALFNGFDAGGRDAGAWEVQDNCDGHPQNEGIYHYHTLSSCIKDISVKTVIGFALDGYPITGPQVGTGNILTTSDLDECHGLTSQVVLDGKNVTTYHYVMTQDFPYSISCFRAKPIQPPGQNSPSP